MTPTIRDNYRLCREATIHGRRRAVLIALSAWLLDRVTKFNGWATRP